MDTFDSVRMEQIADSTIYETIGIFMPFTFSMVHYCLYMTPC